MSATVRIYDLAKELKQEPKRVIEELRREGADVSVPSNSVSSDLADKIRNKYFPKAEAAPKRGIKVVKTKKSSVSTQVETRRKVHPSVFDTKLASPDTQLITLPESWKFTSKGVYEFDNFLSYFDWTLKDEDVKIDFRNCKTSNYQALSLLILYIWHLKRNGCSVDIVYGADSQQSVTTMWWNMNAEAWLHVLNSPTENFNPIPHKHLFAIRRNGKDLEIALHTLDRYSKKFDIEYKKALHYIILEFLYNAQEHGRTPEQIPALLQFSWYRQKNELSFIVADVGVGIRKHLSQAYPYLSSDVEAIELALKPNVSGTFVNLGDPYQTKNNFGYGLFISSNLLKRLHADIYIVSGEGLIHISPVDITRKTVQSSWHGTFVYVTVKLGLVTDLNTQKMIAEAIEAAEEMLQVESKEEKETFYFNVRNYFGPDAVDKFLAIKLRDQKLLPAIAEGKSLIIDFENTVSAPHSLLNALLATPIQRLGLPAYKKIKIINAKPEIREIIDYILDENTTSK